MKSKTYDPVWRCIYCGETKDEAKLTREHIIPFGFAGSLILPKASCLDCADKTKKFEQFLQRDTYGILRAHLNLPTRRPDERPKTWPLEFFRGDQEPASAKMETIDAPIEDYPFMFTMPIFDVPGILRGKEGLEAWDRIRLFIRNMDGARMDRLTKRLQSSPSEKITFSNLTPFRMDVLAKSFAKIAHGIAVAEYGFDGFEHLLPDLILGKKDFSPDVFGNCDPSDLRIGDGKDMHEIFLIPIFMKAKTLLVAQIQLFARYEAPTYQVIVGNLRKAADNAPSSSSKPSTQKR
jgi:hypothetical protein